MYAEAIGPSWREQELAEEQADRARLRERVQSGDFYGAAVEARTFDLGEEVAQQVLSMWEAGDLTDDALRAALYPAWFPNRSPVGAIGQRAWLRLFKAAGFFVAGNTVADIEPTFKARTEKPTAPATLWRGAALPSAGRGMSWSLERQVADDFAAEAALRVTAGVWEATVRPIAILAMFNDDNQTEVIVNPDYLRGKRTLVATIPSRWDSDPSILAQRAAVHAGTTNP